MFRMSRFLSHSGPVMLTKAVIGDDLFETHSAYRRVNFFVGAYRVLIRLFLIFAICLSMLRIVEVSGRLFGLRRLGKLTHYVVHT